MTTPDEAAQRLLSIKGPYNWPCGGRTISRDDDIRTVAESVGPMTDALKVCHLELSYMLNAYPERRGGKYEEALTKASAALGVPTGLREKR